MNQFKTSTLTSVMFLFCLLGSNIPSLLSQNLSLDSLLLKNTYPVSIKNGELQGAGGTILENTMEDVQFVAFGEWHNKKAIHKFGFALFKMLHEKHSFNYLALEEDPYLGEIISQNIKSDSISDNPTFSIAKRYPNSFHLITEEELEMISQIGKISKAPSDFVWGLNQVFGATHLYDYLVEVAPNPEALKKITSLRNQALEYEGERFIKNKSYIANIATLGDFTELRELFLPPSGSQAEFLINQLELSNKIFSPYVISPRPSVSTFYESNRARENNMKQLFARKYREAEKAGENPKVLAMLGHLHLFRGLSSGTEIFTLGNFLSELANFNNKKSIHIYGLLDLPSIYKGWQNELAEAAAKTAKNNSSDGSIIDLRPLKYLVRDPNIQLDPEVKRLILGYDFFLLLMDSESGSVSKLRTPNFRMYPSE